MKKIILLGLVALVLCGVTIAGWRWATEWRFVETTDDAYVDGDITTMAPKISGYVIDVAVADNQPVKAGDVLIRIDDRDYRAKVADAKATLQARQASLAQLEDRIAVQRATIEQASAGISSARADVVRASADLQRARHLVRDDFTSRQTLDTRAADAAKAQASLSGSNAQAVVTRRQMAVLEAERSISEAQVKQAQAQLDLAQSDLDATIIRAPVDGVIGNRAARVGLYVRPGQLLLAVVPLATVWIDANFKETQIGAMAIGHTARIQVDAFPGVELTGRVTGFSPASGAKFSLLPPENATGNFTKVVQRLPVRIVLPADNPLAGRLSPGLSVVVHVDLRDGRS